MAESGEVTTAGAATTSEDVGTSYEVIRARLVEQGRVLGERADALNKRRLETFGTTELQVIGNERLRTENNATATDIVAVGNQLLFGFNTVLGLRAERSASDVLQAHQCEQTDEGWLLDHLAASEGIYGLLAEGNFLADFAELFRYYKNARFLRFVVSKTKLLAVFLIGESVTDIRVFRWALDASGRPTYLDARGEKDYAPPPAHDFTWTATTRDDHVKGKHPHVSVRDKVFVECVGGDLTVKVEDNTEDGAGVYSEPVQEAGQTLDDAEIAFAELGTLILLRIKPYREETTRYLVFGTRTHKVVRVDVIGASCVQLPEDHGVMFPGGYFLQDGQHKLFDGDWDGYRFERMLRSPNGEDVLFVFHRVIDGRYALLTYNLIRKEVGTPIVSAGWSLFDDGRLVVLRAAEEASKVHQIQIWKTTFLSEVLAAAAPSAPGLLGKIGNADLVRGISDALSVRRMIDASTPTRQIYEDLLAYVTKTVDAYYWLGESEVGDLRSTLIEIRRTAELVVDEFDKVMAIRKRAADALKEAVASHRKLIDNLRTDSYKDVAQYMTALTGLRSHRGHLISLKELRYMDLKEVDALEAQAIEAYDRVSQGTIRFLLNEEALEPLKRAIEENMQALEKVETTLALAPLAQRNAETSEGLTVLSEVVGNLRVDDPNARTQILERISEVFAQVNRGRASVEAKRRELMGAEGRAEFAAQFKLFAQSIASAIALADTPDRCDEQLSRLLVQLEELEGRFSEFDEFVGELTAKREEVYEAFGQRKQQLVDERQRRAENLATAAARILGGVARRALSFKQPDELNAYFAADPMVHKLGDIAEKLTELGDTVRAEEVASKLKTARQDALRAMRDRSELFAEGEDLIKFGRHRFTVNTRPLELGLLPSDGQMLLTLSPTDFREPIADEAFASTRDYWEQQLVSETADVYRGEFLAGSLLFEAMEERNGSSLQRLHDAQRTEGGLAELVRKAAADRYDEGHERGVHDQDATQILSRLLVLYEGAGLLRFSPRARGYACLFWSRLEDRKIKEQWHLRARSLGRLRAQFGRSAALDALVEELAGRMASQLKEHGLALDGHTARVAAEYLVEELMHERVRFTSSGEAIALRERFLEVLDRAGSRTNFEDEVRKLGDDAAARWDLTYAWLNAWIGSRGSEGAAVEHLREEVVSLILTEGSVDRNASAAVVVAPVEGLLGQHPRIVDRVLQIRLDEFLARIGSFIRERVPGFKEYRNTRQLLLEQVRKRLRLNEFQPKVLSAFVRNKLINDVYLPLVGDNLAKQMGAAGDSKRTDLMGMLLLISPPGYGKTTLMEYVANRLGLVFVKVNGPSLGHEVVSFDPAQAPNATSRQEVEKINFAFEMGNNVMLYLDDIQHTSPELLQKFISLCDAQRRVEGVWRGNTRTYDFRGKKFCVVMAGNPYTETGEKFKIPDMLANRADTYNLGDVLSGSLDAFELSYIENAITSNSTLAPLATREQADIYKLIDMARGREVAATELSHGYSGAEISEIVAVLKNLFHAQRTILKVNLEYIRSAGMDDAYRTEPPFKLQGSYRNMNKLAEKIVAAMNDEELDRLIVDHYTGESQTLTNGAESNLLKLAELRGKLTPEQSARWQGIKETVARTQRMGGKTDDPVTRVTGQLGVLGDQLEGIRKSLGSSEAVSALGGQLEGIRGVIDRAVAVMDAASKVAATTAAAKAPSLTSGSASASGSSPHPSESIESLFAARDQKTSAALEAALARASQPTHLEVTVQTPHAVEELLAQQVAIVERTLVPLVRVVTDKLEDSKAVEERITQLIASVQALERLVRAGGKIEPLFPTRGGTKPG